MRRTSLALPLAAGLLLAAAPPQDDAGAPEPVLKDREQESLAKEVAAYWEALTETKGIMEAFEELEEAVDKQAKRARGLASGSLLEAVVDWERIFFLANDYQDRDAKKGRVEEAESETPWGPYGYAVSTPKAYSARKGPYPLVLAIGPKGTAGAAHLDAAWADEAVREAAILVAPDMPSDVARWAAFGTPDAHGGIDTVLSAYGAVKATHAVDMDRVLLVGHGEGADAAVAIAAAYPHLFAGVVAAGGEVGDHAATNFRHVPVLLAGAGGEAFASRASELGFEHVETREAADAPALWEWLAAQERDANPAEVTFAPANERALQAYWITVDRVDFDGAPRLHAAVDRATNTITLDAEGIGSATLYLNDAIVDLSKPVRVVSNGVEHEDALPRNLKTMVDLAYYGGDWGRVYVTSHGYDLPARQKEE